MLLKYAGILFIILGMVFTFQLCLLKAGLSDSMKPAKSSIFVSTVAIIMFLYIINSAALALIFPQISQKLHMFGFAIAPFLLGCIANYKNRGTMTIIQILIVLLSIIYVCKLTYFAGA